MPVGDEEPFPRHALSDLPGRVSVHPESSGRGLMDTVGGGVDFYAGNLAQRRAEPLGQVRLVLLDSPYYTRCGVPGGATVSAET